MPSKYQNSTIKVPQSVIDQIKELGMAAAIKKAKSGSASKEFVEGVRRFYPAAVKGASGIDAKTSRRSTSGAGVKTSSSKKSAPSSNSSNSNRKGPQIASASVRRRLSDSGRRSSSSPTTVPGSSSQGSGAAALGNLGGAIGRGASSASSVVDDLMNRANGGFATRNGGRIDFDTSPSDQGIRGLDDWLGRNLRGAAQVPVDLIKMIAANTDSGLR